MTLLSGDEVYDDDVTSGVQIELDPECEHLHVERDDDGLKRRFHVCLDCDAEVILTAPDEDGQSYWEAIS